MGTPVFDGLIYNTSHGPKHSTPHKINVSRLHLSAWSMTTLDNWPCVRLPRPCNVIQHTKRNDCPKAQQSPVKILGCHIPGRGPEAKNEDIEEVSTGERVVGNSKCPVYPPGPPCQIAPYRVCESIVVVSGAYGPRHSTIEEQRRGDEVGAK